jgi:hypothetical protein
MKDLEEIIQSLNKLQKQAKKDPNTKQESSARQVTASKSHSRRDEHGNERKLRSKSIFHHSLGKYTRRAHASLGAGSSPSVSHVKR